MNKDATLLIDSNYIAHQARFALKNFQYEDIPTGVIFGFLNRVLFLGNKFKTNDIVFYWDSKKSLRKRIYPEYKAKRHKDLSDEDRRALNIAFEQFNILKNEILPMIGFVNNITQTGYESDDTIASTVINKLGDFVVITADEDLFQLLDYCNIYNPQKDKLYTRETLVLEKFITPEKYWLVKAIAGCNSDNVKGIQGVGEKTVIKYLNNQLNPKSKAYQKIKNDEFILERNKELVKLPFEGTREPRIMSNSFNMEMFRDICNTYGLDSFLSDSKLSSWDLFFNNDFSRFGNDSRNKITAKEKIKMRRKERGKRA